MLRPIIVYVVNIQKQWLSFPATPTYVTTVSCKDFIFEFFAVSSHVGNCAVFIVFVPFLIFLPYTFFTSMTFVMI